jgi:hypothetical protein
MKPKVFFSLSIASLLLFGSTSIGFAQSTSPSVAFMAPLLYTTGFYSGGIAVGSFRGNGTLDLAVTNHDDNSVSVFLGNGDGTFQNPASYTVGYYPAGIAVGDFGNGHLDLAVANCNSSTSPFVSVLLGNGDGTFEAATNYTVGNGPCGIAVGDFTGVGKLDLVVADYFANNVALLLGKGDGTFESAEYISTGNYAPEYVTVGDFNKDGKLDFAIAGNGMGGVAVFLGNGDGTFKAPTYFATPTGSYSLLTASLRNNGTLDLVTTGTNAVSVLLGNGDGTFQTATSYSVGVKSCFVSGAAVGDFNRDGILDLATDNNDGSTLSVLLGNGDGTFQTQAVNWWIGNYSNLIAAADFNGDGWSDLTVTFGSSGIVLLNTPPTPMQPSSSANLIQQFILNSTSTGYLELDLNYITAYNAGTLTVQPNTIAMVSDPGITQTTYASMVAGTSLATTTCYIAPGEGTDSSGNSLCAPITLTCTNATNSTPAGDNCPTSTYASGEPARYLYWANILETPTPIGGTASSIPSGYGPTLAMGSDTWSPGTCLFNGLETGNLCPQSMLTEFRELSTGTKIKGGGSGGTSNSTYILGCCEPEWSTTATVPAWTNSTTNIPVSFATSPPTLSTPTNGWVAAPNQSMTWGVEPLGQTPLDPTFPISTDQTATNPTPCPSEWISAVAAAANYSGSVSVSGQGIYELHFFSTACDNQEELMFSTPTDPSQDWAAFKTVTFGVDTTAPTVTQLALNSSSNTVLLDANVTASFTCTDPQKDALGNPLAASGIVGCGSQLTQAQQPSPGSGLAGPAAPATSYPFTQAVTTFPVPTSAAGPQTLTVWATDLAGNTGSASVNYTVLKGNTTTTITSSTPNPSAPGQAVLVKFTVTGNGSPTGTVTVSASTGEACPATTLSAGAGSCSLTFVTDGSRTLTASYSGDLNFNSSTSAGVTQSVIGPLASLSSASVNFGNVYLGLLAVQTVALTNVGNAAMSVGKVRVSGGNDPDDYIPLSLCPSTLAAGKGCPIVITFTADGDNYSPTGFLNVFDSAYNSPQTVALSATVINPRASLSTYSLSFGKQTVNTTSAAMTVTLTNTGTGTVPLALSTLTISGDFAFASGTTCANGVALAPTASCTISVTFTPTAKGSRSGKVVITDNALLSPQVISLSGTGN